MAVLKYYNTATSAWEYIAASTTANFTTWKKTVAGGETSVSGTDDNAVTLSYTVGLEQVFINGVLQVRGSDYTATTGTSITGLSALAANDVVTVICYAPFNVANTIAPTLVDAKGDLIAGTAADTVGRLAVGTDGQMLTAASGQSTGLQWVTPEYSGSWTSFTPTITNLTLGNGTVSAKYKQMGKTVIFSIVVTFGTTTSISGSLTFTKPVTSQAGNTLDGYCVYNDNGTDWILGYFIDTSSTQFTITAANASATYVKSSILSSTVPFTWTTNDNIRITGTYEAA